MAQIPINQLVQSTLSAQNDDGAEGQVVQGDIVETQVFIGLNDSETKKQEFNTERYVSVLKRVCVQYGVPFSFDVIEGGYIHDNGEYTEEKSIMLTFIDVQQDTVNEIAQDLCAFFHQESVLITSHSVKARMVHVEPITM